ncbi:MAG: CRISPR system precrRNA processing endoribonuclease RAMP protein Cas6 [bacterium]|nr:CRISPR system precrRNA processing endoribonuclease RAMP protein Cas6 [bacterium]
MKNISLEVYKFQVETKFVNSALLPPFKGATLRGAFGIALKELTCINKNFKDCNLCLLGSKCPFKQIFRVEIEKNNQSHNIPSPFILEPPYENRRFYQQETQFDFGCLIIGKMIDYFPYIVLAFKKMGEKGIGIKGNRSQFDLLKITSKNKIVYDGSQGILNEYRYPEKIQSTKSSIDTITLKFISPTRIKSDSTLTKDLSFELLMKTLLRRISLLKKNYCENGKLEIDYDALMEKARKIETVFSNLKWYDWQRYSTRQNTSMKLGGFVGEICYKGNLSEFMNYLKIGELIHIGKNTSFGLGKYVIINADKG